MKYELKLDRSELVNGLKRLRKTAKRKTKSDAVFTFEKGNFVVFLDGVSIEVAAAGAFPGMVRISGIKALNLAEILPTDDPLTIGLDRNKLFLGRTFSMPCIWHNVAPNPVQLPIDPSLPVLLAVSDKYSDEEISQSGLTDQLAKAEARAKGLITQAANILIPLGISRDQVQKLVDEVVAQIDP